MADTSASDSPAATIVITSRNRKDDLLKAVESCFTQDLPLEVLVLDDDSTDGTSEAVKSQFPAARVIRSPSRVGLIALRNKGAEHASCEIIFSIDDDAVFTTPRIVRQTLEDFTDPRVGAVGIPYQNIRQSEQVHQAAPSKAGIFVLSAYVGTAHAVRRDLFLALGGYHASLVHQGEESDYCVRLLNAGYVTRVGRADVIHHFMSPARDLSRMDFYGARNAILFHWHNAPLLSLPVRIGATIVGTIRFGLRHKMLKIKLKALLAAHVAIFRLWGERKPVSKKAFRLFRRLQHDGPMLIQTIEKDLGPRLEMPSPAPRVPPPAED